MKDIKALHYIFDELKLDWLHLSFLKKNLGWSDQRLNSYMNIFKYSKLLEEKSDRSKGNSKVFRLDRAYIKMSFGDFLERVL